MKSEIQKYFNSNWKKPDKREGENCPKVKRGLEMQRRAFEGGQLEEYSY